MRDYNDMGERPVGALEFVLSMVLIGAVMTLLFVIAAVLT